MPVAPSAMRGDGAPVADAVERNGYLASWKVWKQVGLKCNGVEAHVAGWQNFKIGLNTRHIPVLCRKRNAWSG